MDQKPSAPFRVLHGATPRAPRFRTWLAFWKLTGRCAMPQPSYLALRTNPKTKAQLKQK